MKTTRPHLRVPRASRSLGRRRRQLGVATLEFAFIAPIFFLLLFAILEIGIGQAEAVCGLLEGGNLQVLRTVKDLAQIPRAIVALRNQ